MEGYDKNSNVWKDKITIPMLIKIGPEFHNFEGYEQKTNVDKNRAGIPLFGRRTSEN